MSLEKVFNKTKVGLMMKGAIFLSTITFSLKHRFSKSIPTAGTNGIEVIYNPDWFMNLKEDERVGLLAHETWHVALNHITRCGKRDPKVWNYAGDHVINLMLKKSGYALPPDGLCDDKFTDWSTIQVYDDLIQNPQPEPPNYQMDIIQPGNGNGKEDPNAAQGPDGVMSAQGIENEIKGIIVKASTQSKLSGEKAGSVPGEVERMIDKLINPKINYAELLRRFMDSHIKEDYSYRRPNRRFPDMIMPSQWSESLGEIGVAIDTSGSIDDDDIIKMLSEITHIYEHYKPEKMTILDCDEEIHNTHVVTKDSNTVIANLKFTGGGGTSFTPVIEHFKKNPPKVLIYFTDLYANEIRKDPGFPIIWLCYSTHKPAKIGETIYYDPDEQ